jgi:RNA polymerase sigma-70 factor (ECF subfamily)
MVALRMDRRVRQRVDPSDVLQEAYIEAAQRLPAYAAEQGHMPLYLWLRFLTGQKLLQMHRKHRGRERDAARDLSIFQSGLPEASSAVLAAKLVGKWTSPSRALMRAERKLRVEEALNAMAPLDREILTLRHFEQLSGVEAACVLGIEVSAASKRYARALERLSEILGARGEGEGADERRA